LNKYGRPLLGCTIKPKLGLSAKNYGRAGGSLTPSSLSPSPPFLKRLPSSSNGDQS
jgi:hypothetical protein